MNKWPAFGLEKYKLGNLPHKHCLLDGMIGIRPVADHVIVFCRCPFMDCRLSKPACGAADPWRTRHDPLLD